MRARPTKYGNRRTEVDGISFASKAEAKRYGELKLLERAGKIAGLRLQPRFAVVINDVHCFTYVADFGYRDSREIIDRSKREVSETIEDVKGVETALFKLKKKCVEATYPGVTISLVKVRG